MSSLADTQVRNATRSLFRIDIDSSHLVTVTNPDQYDAAVPLKRTRTSSAAQQLQIIMPWSRSTELDTLLSPRH